VQAIFLHFALEFLFLQGAMETAEHHVRIKGLQQIVVGAQLHGAHTDARFVFARNHQESQARIPLANFNQEIRAGDAGNAQIRNYDVAWVAWGESSRRKRRPGQFMCAAVGSRANRACRNGTGWVNRNWVASTRAIDESAKDCDPKNSCDGNFQRCGNRSAAVTIL
jgi:hypothetical protein